MKTDDFEEQLRQQPFRKVPAEWRQEILGRAQQAAERCSPAEVQEVRECRAALSFWREWLWPSPKAWGALACIWVLLFLTGFWTSEFAPANGTTGWSLELSPEKVMALREQRLLRAELFEMVDHNTTMPAPAPKPRTKVEGEWLHA